jgi:hypothetical protein
MISRRARVSRATQCLLISLIGIICCTVIGQETSSKSSPPRPKPDFPPLSKVVEGYVKEISTADGQPSLMTIWKRTKDAQMLASLPRGYDKKRFFIAMTISSGEEYAGLQAGDMYVYWKRYDKRIALVEPNIEVRSTGDSESKSSVKRLYTDRIIMDFPIIAMSGSSPVIDMDAMLIGQASKFFGGQIRVSNSRLATIKKAKAFPKNVELAFEVPTQNGRLQTLHYSISEIPQHSGYRPRKADTRVGYFTTFFSDYGDFEKSETKVRYINRWKLEKRDSSLDVSPAKEPIVFYIEHTTPVRYRRWIRKGILSWNKAFEKVGISDAIEVIYQDAATKAHMDKDPEDVRYNFVRWLSNNQGTAIGPSRVHPETGQILDADIILTDGWIRHFWQRFHEVMPEIAMDGLSPDTLAWLADHEQWDPRIQLAPPCQREHVRHELQANRHLPYHGHPASVVSGDLMGDDAYDGLGGRTSQVNGMCTLSRGKAFDVAIFRMMAAAQECKAAEDPNDKESINGDGKGDTGKEDEDTDVESDKKKKEGPVIDGMPESFIGPLVADLTCHEVGHTLGLRHNFKGSALYSLEQINSDDIKSNGPFAASVMDYLPVNINMEDGEIQGDYAMTEVGPYDEWAIQYGYAQSDRELAKILQRVAEPELQYATDEDVWGPDPLARQYDFSSDPLEYANNQIRIAKMNRTRIIDDLVKKGDSWAKTRKAYEMTLGLQIRAVSMMANWLGGAHIYRDKKGDKNGRLPIEVVSAKKQRDALEFVIAQMFEDESFGLSRDLLQRMTVDKWWDDAQSIMTDPTWPVHDMIMSLQSSMLARLMYPSVLSRIYDNELLVADDEDVLTLPELLTTITDSVWKELGNAPTKTYTARKPYVSSLRRNLQRQHIELLIDLIQVGGFSVAAYKPISNLVLEQVRQIKQTYCDKILRAADGKLDPYTAAHLKDVRMRIEKALDAQYVLRNL